MNDRDTFAAAALTGLLATGQGPYHNAGYFSKAAYDSADAMLAERKKNAAEFLKNHDAVPAARAEDLLKEPNGSSTGQPGGEPESAVRTGTLTEAEVDALEYVVEKGRIASNLDYGILRSLLVRLRPEWEGDKPPPHATHAQGSVRDSRIADEPVAWAVVSDSNEEIDCEFIYPDEATAGDVAIGIEGKVVPLYAHPPHVVRLPKPPEAGFKEAAFASGWFFCSSQVKGALRDAGVKWEVEQ